MKFEHKVTVDAPVATVRAFLDDFRKASACVPGLESVEEIEPDVKTAWLGEQKAAAWKKAYDAMRAKYIVLLPIPPDGAKP